MSSAPTCPAPDPLGRRQSVEQVLRVHRKARGTTHRSWFRCKVVCCRGFSHQRGRFWFACHFRRSQWKGSSPSLTVMFTCIAGESGCRAEAGFQKDGDVWTEHGATRAVLPLVCICSQGLCFNTGQKSAFHNMQEYL